MNVNTGQMISLADLGGMTNPNEWVEVSGTPAQLAVLTANVAAGSRSRGNRSTRRKAQREARRRNR